MNVSKLLHSGGHWPHPQILNMLEKGAKTLSITTFGITTLSAKGLVNDTDHY
jgi:hypothetical protein